MSQLLSPKKTLTLLKEKNRRLFPETESNASIECRSRCRRKNVDSSGEKKSYFVSWGPFLESPGNLPGPISDFGNKCFLTEVNFSYL